MTELEYRNFYELLLVLIIMLGFTSRNSGQHATQIIGSAVEYKERVKQDSLVEHVDTLINQEKWDSLLSYSHLLLQNSRYDSLLWTKMQQVYDKIWQYRSYCDSTKHRKSLKFLSFYQRKHNGDMRASLLTNLRGYQILRDKVHGDEHCWHIENWLGNAYTQLGDFDQALYYYKITQNAFRKRLISNNSPKLRARLSRSYKNVAICYYSKNDYEQSEAAYLKGIEIAGDAEHIIIIHNVGLLDLLINTGQLNRAKALIDSGTFLNIQVLDSIHDLGITTEYTTCLADFHALDGNHELAKKIYLETFIQERSQYNNPYNRELVKPILKISKHLIEIDQIDEADSWIQLGFHYLNSQIDSSTVFTPDVSMTYAENKFLELYEERAKIYKIKFDRSNSIAYLDSALVALNSGQLVNDELRELYTMENSRELSVTTNRKNINLGIEICYKGYRLSKQRRFLQKARSLFNSSKGILFNTKRDQNSQLAHLTITQRSRVDFLQNELTKLYTREHQSDSINQTVLLQKIENEKELKSLLASDSIQHEHDFPDAFFIEYALTDNDLYALHNFDQGIQFIRVCQKDSLLDLLYKFKESLISEDISIDSNSLTGISRINKISHLFSNLLLKNISKLPSTFNIIPDGPLSLVSFDVLVDNNNQYLIKNHTIGYLHHYHQLFEESPSMSGSLIAFAPTYEKSDNNEVARTRSDLYFLEHNQTEVSSILLDRNNQSDTLINDHSNLLAQLLDFDHFHYAGHAKSTNETSFLAPSSNEDQRIFHEEIERSHLPLNLVTLSACETGIGRSIEGEGLKSMARSFSIAGAKNVITSLWTVNDQSTSVIMKSFYRHLKKSQNAAIALRKAKLDFIASASPEFQHPYYWAGFVAYGKSSTTSDPLYIVFIGLFILLLTCLFIYKFIHLKNNAP